MSKGVCLGLDMREVEIVLNELISKDKKREVVFLLLALDTPLTTQLISELKMKNFRKKYYITYKDDTEDVDIPVSKGVWEVVDRFLHDDEYIMNYDNDDEYVFKRMCDMGKADKACSEHAQDCAIFATADGIAKEKCEGVQSFVVGRFSNKALKELYMKGYREHCLKLMEAHPYFGQIDPLKIMERLYTN